MQGWSLERKIQVTQTRLLEWYQKNNNKCYVSFSGGKDSTVLAWLAAHICNMLNCNLVLWFSDTGLEFPELREHVKTYAEWLRMNLHINVETIIDTPKDRKGKRIVFKDVVLSKGYPIISKEISNTVESARSLLSKGKDGDRLRKIQGRSYMKNGEPSHYNCKKYEFLLDAPFKISAQCCDIMKKRPAKSFEKKTGLKPIIGTMACESRMRKNAWLKNGCNAFDSKRQISQPMSFWTEQDVLECLYKYEIPYPSVYGEIKKDENGKWYTTGYNRTGCMFCGYGCHLEKEPNRFQILKETHPKIWEYCMKPVSEGGLGMKEVLEYIGVKIE